MSAVALILLAAAANLLYLIHDCPLELTGDEAHYWEWSRRLDLSYYSKGPLVAYIIAAGRWAFGDLSIRLVGNESLAVRIPAVLLSALTSLGIYVLALRTLRRPALALGALALTACVPILVAGSKLMTIDAPLAACWVWALLCLLLAAQRTSPALWIATGVLAAIGLLAKYNMVLLFPVALLWSTGCAAMRMQFKKPWPYIAAALAASGLIPIAVWNARHDWVSFRHVAGQAGLADAGPQFALGGPLEYLGGQFAVIGPLSFLGIVLAWTEFARRPQPHRNERHDHAGMRLLLWASVVPFAAFVPFSFWTKIQPNWPVLGVLPALPLLAAWLARRGADGRSTTSVKVFLAALIITGVTPSIILHRSEWLSPAIRWLTRAAPPWDLTPATRWDPTARLRGWSQLAAAVDAELAKQSAAGRECFVLTDDYQLSSLLAFYLPGHPPVYCAQAALGDRRSQYDIWDNPLTNLSHFVNRPILYVGALRPELDGRDGGSAALPGIRAARTIEHAVGGNRLHVWTIYVAEQFAGFQRSPVPPGY